MQFLLVVAVPVVILMALGYWGLHVVPKGFAPFPAPTQNLPTVEMPSDLPAPVARYFRVALGDRVPVLTSAVISGRGHIRIKGIRFPARYRFTHLAGQGYRHYIETTFFGLPLLKVNESYLNGHARMELPMGVIANDAKTDMAANLGLWGESFFLPAIFLTDSRVRWEPVDETHARLVVPFGAATDSILVAFDLETGLISQMEAMRWKEPTSQSKLRWTLGVGAWQRFAGMLLPAHWSLTWEDDHGPWFAAKVEDAVYNVDVSEYLLAKGP